MKAPFPFPLTVGDIECFTHPAEDHAFHRPHIIDGALCAGNGHIAIRAERGRWMASDFTTPPTEFLERFARLPWGAIHGDSPEWRRMDDVRGTIYRYASIGIWTEKKKRSPSPVVEIGKFHLIRLSHLQLIARLPRCEVYAGPVTRHDPLFFRYNGGTVIVPIDRGLTTASFGIFAPSLDILTHERNARSDSRPLIHGGHLKGWPPQDQTND
jgi:hypothetical protein